MSLRATSTCVSRGRSTLAPTSEVRSTSFVTLWHCIFRDLYASPAATQEVPATASVAADTTPAVTTMTHIEQSPLTGSGAVLPPPAATDASFTTVAPTSSAPAADAASSSQRSSDPSNATLLSHIAQRCSHWIPAAAVQPVSAAANVPRLRAVLHRSFPPPERCRQRPLSLHVGDRSRRDDVGGCIGFERRHRCRGVVDHSSQRRAGPGVPATERTFVWSTVVFSIFKRATGHFLVFAAFSSGHFRWVEAVKISSLKILDGL